MRVLHLLKTAVGASWALRQTKELVALGVEVHLAVPPGPMIEKYQKAGVIVHVFDASINFKKPWQNIAKAKAFRLLLDKVKPDLVHSHFVATTLLMRFAMRKSAIPKIFHVPGPLHLEHTLFRELDLKTANKKDYWMASCLWTKDKYQSHGIEKKKVGLAYYGVDEVDFVKPEPTTPKENLRQLLDMSEGAPLIGMVAYFYPPKAYLGQKRGLKGHEDLIDAMKLVASDFPDAKCVFVGGPWGDSEKYYLQVQRYAEQVGANNCVFLGFRSDVPSLYQQFDLAVHPSHSENVGGAVESMYANIITLTTRVGGFVDLVKDDITGYLAEPHNPESLARKIRQALESRGEKKEAMLKEAFEKVTSVMNVKDNAKQVLAFYHHVLQQERSDD
jgi:glycosyltransferase involved in cell wall biosynthesis